MLPLNKIGVPLFRSFGSLCTFVGEIIPQCGKIFQEHQNLVSSKGVQITSISGGWALPQ